MCYLTTSLFLRLRDNARIYLAYLTLGGQTCLPKEYLSPTSYGERDQEFLGYISDLKKYYYVLDDLASFLTH